MRRLLVLAFCASLGLGSLCSSSPAAADDDAQLELLRRQFREGIAFEADEKWAEALRVFNQVAAQRASAQVRFHIALCEEHLGHLRAALEGFREALQLAQADPAAAKEVVDNAPARIRELSARVPRVSLVVEDEGTAEVLIDDESLGAIRGTKEVLLDPGAHRISIKAGKKTRLLRELELSERDRVEVEIPSEVAVTVGPKRDAIVPVEPPVVPAPEGNKVPFYAVGSLGLGALVGAGVMVGLRQVAIDEVRGSCSDPDAGTGCDPLLEDVAQRGRSYEYAAWGLAAGGAACLGVATILFFTIGQSDPAPKAPARPAARSAGWPRPSGVVVLATPAGLTLRGRFE